MKQHENAAFFLKSKNLLKQHFNYLLTYFFPILFKFKISYRTYH
jgi:hypothetical protein